MWTHDFVALGTAWHLAIDDFELAKNAAAQKKLIDVVIVSTTLFEQKFSRFKSDSLVSAFAQATAGTYSIDPTLAKLLQFAKKLQAVTDGAFNPVVAPALSALGYDTNYSFTPNQAALDSWSPPEWSISDTQLTISGPTCFDLGGIAKGYWIDEVSALIVNLGYPYHLVDGGGDMYATTKRDGGGWTIAAEWPNKPDTALAVVELKHQGFAASDTCKRRWSNTAHHLVDAKTALPLTHLLGSVAVAPSALIADGCTAVACQLLPEAFPTLEIFAQKHQAACLVVYADNHIVKTRNWP